MLPPAAHGLLPAHGLAWGPQQGGSAVGERGASSEETWEAAPASTYPESLWKPSLVKTRAAEGLV